VVQCLQIFMYKSPFMNAGMVSTVHGGAAQLTEYDRWPYMRPITTLGAPNKEIEREGEKEREREREKRRESAEDEKEKEEPGSEYSAYTKLVKSTTIPTALGIPKHVFKVRETTKLLLFLGIAVGGIVLLDLTSKLIVSISQMRNPPK
jgi:hypothetical protein